ncbi:leukocyte surface antigen CD53-like [Glandiceps talaboti]
MSEEDLKDTLKSLDEEFESRNDIKSMPILQKKCHLKGIILAQIGVFLLCGILLIVFGIWIIVDHSSCNSVSAVSLYLPCVLTIIAGVFVCVVSCADTLILHSSRTRDLRWFVGALTLSVLLGLSAVITSAVKTSKLTDGGTLYLDMLSAMQSYELDEDITRCWDILQPEKQCCGTNNFTDWLQLSNIITFPSSCQCDLYPYNARCVTINNSTHTYSDGCHDKLASSLKYYFGIVELVNCVIIVLEVTVAIVSLCSGCRIFRHSVVATYVVET